MTTTTDWIVVPPAAMQGEGLRPYAEGEITNLFDWAENIHGTSTHLMPYRRQFIVDVVEIEANAVHQPSKPGDEVVLVLNGTLRLTDDADGTELEVATGEMVLIPAGWAGLYRVIPGAGHFRELAIVPGDYFDPALSVAPSGLRPRPLILPTDAGRHLLHSNRYSLEADISPRPQQWSINATGDEIICIRSGTLELTADSGSSATFGPGNVVVLPAGLTGQATAAADYQALVARWLP